MNLGETQAMANLTKLDQITEKAELELQKSVIDHEKDKTDMHNLTDE